MSDFPNTFEALIETWGIGQFAADIGVPYSTANAMKQRNSVPAKYSPRLLEKAPASLGLTPERLIAMQERAGKVAA
jgi:hypothetical protein